MLLLEGKGLSKTFPIEGGVLRRTVGQVAALTGLFFGISRGESLALVGGSGSGKSTLAKIIAGLLRPDAGELMWEEQPLESFSPLERARKIQMIFQDPYASLNPKLSIGTQLQEVLRQSGGAPAREPADLLKAVGLSPDITSHYPFQFSGGQRQRIAIARALAMNPELLIADEPLSALDVTTQAHILDLFRSLRETYRLTFLFITHDLAVARAFCDRIIVLKEGKTVEEGPTRAVLDHPQAPYTRELLAAVPQIPC